MHVKGIPGSSTLRGDLTAGLTTAVMLIPQAMAYAILAGLPPIVGLYASAVPLVAYALVGSSPVLAVGPVAMDSLLTAATVGAFAVSGSDRYLELAALLAFMVGALQLLFGLVRGGVLVNFLSAPVIGGFTSAAALIIGASQLSTLLGIDLPRSSSVVQLVGGALQGISEIHGPTFGLATASMLGLWALKRYAPRWPRALIVVALAALVVYLGDLEAMGVSTIGEIPAGLPSFVLPSLDLDAMRDLIPGAFTIAMVAFMEGISISSKLASQSGQRVDANRELSALGLANLSAALFGGYPVAGGLSRTAVNAEAGARTKLAGVVSAAAVVASLLWLTPLLHPVPRATLGAIIAMAVGGLFDWKEAIRLWRLNRGDGSVLGLTFLSTLMFGIQEGILSGIAFSMLLVVLRASRPRITILGHLPDRQRCDDIEHYPEAKRLPGVMIVRSEARLFFANTQYLREKLLECEGNEESPVHTVILSASGINGIDSSALLGLASMLADYKKRGLRFVLAGVQAPVLAALRRADLEADFRQEGIFESPYAALRELGILKGQDSESCLQRSG